MRLYTSLEEENEEGCVCLKLFQTGISNLAYANFCIKRASSKDNFKKWTDIKIISWEGESLEKLPVIKDYTIESGVYYKYSIDFIESNGTRVYKGQTTNIIKRDFEFSYLLGENGRQLKLKFDNKINSFSHQVSDSKNDTIGSKYPFITRNGMMDYKSFPLEGLISFHMDEQYSFISQQEILNMQEDVYRRYIDEDKNSYDIVTRENIVKIELPQQEQTTTDTNNSSNSNSGAESSETQENTENTNPSETEESTGSSEEEKTENTETSEEGKTESSENNNTPKVETISHV